MITGLILAAGQGKRLGAVKPLLPTERGMMLDIVLRQYRTSALDDLILVLGSEAGRICQKISLGGLKVVINGQYRVGLSGSIQRGLAHVAPGTKAVAIALGDMPLVTTATINTLVREFKKGKSGIIVPVHNKQRGHPVLIDLKYLDDLLELRGDKGAKALLDMHATDVREVKIKSDEILLDVDTLEDWEKIQDRLAGSPVTATVR